MRQTAKSIAHVIARYRVVFDEELAQFAVGDRTRQNGCPGLSTVAPRAPRLLIVSFWAFGKPPVKDEAHIGLIHAHAKSVRRHQKRHLPGNPRLLNRAAGIIIHARVVNPRP